MKVIKSTGQEKILKWEIVKILLANSPGYDYGVNPKEIVEELMLGGLDATPIEIGRLLVKMGFREKTISGKLYRTIYIKRLKQLEYELVAQDEKQIEKIKPLLIQLYHKGYDSADDKQRKTHDKIAEPIRQLIGKWYCQTSIKEIKEYLEKCKAEGLVLKEV